MSYQLRRLHFPLTDANSSGHVTYAVVGTDLRVLRHGRRGWEIRAALCADAAADWLDFHDLADVVFDTRSQAVRALQAAAALNPPPAALAAIRQVRRPDGQVEMIDPDGNSRLLTRTASGWQMNDPWALGNPLVYMPTLASARQRIALHWMNHQKVRGLIP